MTPEQVKELQRLQRMLAENRRQGDKITRQTNQQIKDLLKSPEMKSAVREYKRASNAVAKLEQAATKQSVKLRRIEIRLQAGIAKAGDAIERRIDILTGRLSS